MRNRSRNLTSSWNNLTCSDIFQRQLSEIMQVNQIVHGDCVKRLGVFPDSVADLVYLDPPFFAGRVYSCERSGKDFSFSDVWEDGLDQYLKTMDVVIRQSHRILKKTGLLFLHCDWHASHYLKVLVDKIFDYRNFRNEIVWKRHNSHSDSAQGAKNFGRVHDVIFIFSKSSDYKWNAIYTPYSQKYVDKFYRFVNNDGRRYALGDLSGPGGKSKGNPKFSINGHVRYWRFNETKMNSLIQEGRIIFSNSGFPYYKRFLDEMKGLAVQDVWDDIDSPQVSKKEDVGYPTQKPVSLLERIISVATDENDLVVDPFCGSGTALLAAKKLKRNCIGIDINPLACELSKQRLGHDRIMPTTAPEIR